jgi:hypothetical protein
MTFQWNDTVKKISIGAAIVIVVALVIFFGARSNRNHAAITTGDMNKASDATTSQTAGSGVVASQPKQQTVNYPTVASVVTRISAQDGATPSDVKRGTYSVLFNVQAKGTDVYFSPSCQPVSAPVTNNGATFALIKDGVRADNTVFAADSCVILNRGLAEKTSTGNYLIKAGTENVFELVVVDHPKAHGDYKVRITQVGYATTDKTGDKLFFISEFDSARLKTSALSL